MEPVSAVDRLVLMLRQRLQARSRVRSASPRSRSSRASPRSALKALDLTGMEDGALQRVIIQSVLVDHFGQEMMNDARFQQMVSRVVETIVAEPKGRSLMDQVLNELRGAGPPTT